MTRWPIVQPNNIDAVMVSKGCRRGTNRWNTIGKHDASVPSIDAAPSVTYAAQLAMLRKSRLFGKPYGTQSWTPCRRHSRSSSTPLNAGVPCRLVWKSASGFGVVFESRPFQ